MQDLTGDAAHVRHAGAHGLAADQHGAGAADSDSAAVFGAFQVQHIAQDPQERRVGWHVDGPEDIVHIQFQWHWGHLIGSVAQVYAEETLCWEIYLPARGRRSDSGHGRRD